FFEDCDKPFLTVVGSTRLETAVAEFFGDCRGGLAVGRDAQNFLLTRSCHAPPRMTSRRSPGAILFIQHSSAMNCEKSPYRAVISHMPSDSCKESSSECAVRVGSRTICPALTWSARGPRQRSF